ncbi:MAG: hypothetical protein LBC58_02140, partial [Clostridiales Family XIII bacterium]|nr:hypothetical protein [Clostridiales Family XIII bacterium]
MKKNTRNKAIALITALTLILSVSAPAAFAESGASNAPNEQASAAEPVAIPIEAVTPKNIDAEPSPSGYIDPGIDMSNVNDYDYGVKAVKNAKQRMLGADTLPDTYNVPVSYVQAVRDQGSGYGTCWAFAALASVSSSLVRNEVETTSVPLSPKQLVYAAINKDTFGPLRDKSGNLLNGGLSMKAG